MPQQIRLVIAEDKMVFRYAVRRLLDAQPNFKVLEEVSDGAEAVKLTRQLQPDILLLELSMPHSGLEALRELSIASSPVRVILFTWHPLKKSQISEALQLGARGVVLTFSARQTLLKAIQVVMAGEYWV